MTGLLLFLGVIVLISVALEVTHRRAAGSWRPGLDTRRDRDADRLQDDLRHASQREPQPPAPPAVSHLTVDVAKEAWRFSRAAA